MTQAKLYNVELARGKFSKEIVMRNVHYGLAAQKRKELWASGVIRRNVWITPVDKPKSVLNK